MDLNFAKTFIPLNPVTNTQEPDAELLALGGVSITREAERSIDPDDVTLAINRHFGRCGGCHCTKKQLKGNRLSCEGHGVIVESSHCSHLGKDFRIVCNFETGKTLIRMAHEATLCEFRAAQRSFKCLRWWRCSTCLAMRFAEWASELRTHLR